MFNEDEIELLFSALDALQHENSSQALVSTMIMAMMPRDQELTPGELTENYNSQVETEQQQVLEERVILLKAKLIGIRDKAIADSFEV